jgi:hypothetical protein
MGVLDDAIREHLELKRQHGATEAEISRAEAEALGPARRAAPAPAQETAGADDDDETAADAGETLIIPPAEDPAPPPGLEPTTHRVAPVHDIDDELSPPTPVSGPPGRESEADDEDEDARG